MDCTGIILAGGKSSRMGSDKGLLPYKGKPLVTYAIEVLRPLTDRIIIVGNNEAYKQFDCPLIPDEIADCGPPGRLVFRFESQYYGTEYTPEL